ncbi:MAG: InlB B-repeat-containing protein [Treponema sp.]|nr:InlB B-repeat-containing protein [Treponema sp.]
MKTTAIKHIPLLLVCAVFTLAGCFSAWEGDEAALTLHLGSSGSRSAADNFQPEDLYHKITISDASGGVVREKDIPPGEMTVQEILQPGRYNIEVIALVNPNGTLPVAAGTARNVNIRAGNNTVSINMEWYFTVTFDTDGGSLAGVETGYVVFIKDGGKVPPPPFDPTWEGHRFEGWFTDGGTNWNFNNDTVTGDTTLTARWVEDDKERFIVTFDADGGEFENGEEMRYVEIDKGEKITDPPPDPILEGFEFVGWFIDDIEWNFDNDTVSNNTTLTARWVKDGVERFTVTFNTNGGSFVDGTETEFSVEDGERITAPSAPTKDGYTFVGWFIDDIEWDFNDIVTEDITLTANWVEDSNTFIKIIFLEDMGAGVLEPSVDNFTIDKGSSTYDKTKTITIEGDYDYIQWFMWGQPMSQFNGESAITIDAKDYAEGRYQLTIVVWIGPTPYSAEITFTVTD